tara:strand:+ start:17888 stop:18067 length:180 start_codon:yes stop_codon:yes gene_type:complete
MANLPKIIKDLKAEKEQLHKALTGMVDISKFWADEWDLDIGDFDELITAKELLHVQGDK